MTRKIKSNSLPFEGEMGASPRKDSDFQIPTTKKKKPYSNADLKKPHSDAKKASQFA